GVADVDQWVRETVLRPFAVSGTATAIGDGWSSIYLQGFAYYADLDRARPGALDPALAAWLARHRWGFGTAAGLRAQLASDVGAEIEAQAWCEWMAGRWPCTDPICCPSWEPAP